jgi:hypothetical protein
MTEPEFTSALSSGAITSEETTPTPETPQAVQPSYSLEQFLPILLQLQSTQQYVTAAPTYIPQTFQEQIQFVYTGGTYYLYLYFNNQWTSISSSATPGVIQLIAGSGISLSPSGGTGTVTVNATGGAAYTSLFGDGIDGSVTFDGSTTILGMVPSSNVYTLTRNIYCGTIIVNSGVTIKSKGFRIFANVSLTNNGTISAIGNNGTSASGSTGGTGAIAAYTGNPLPPALASGKGGNGTGPQTGGATPGGNGTAGTTANPALGTSASSVSGGGGGGGTAGTQYAQGGGGGGGTGGVATAAVNPPHTAANLWTMLEDGTTSQFQGSASAGGGGGGGGGGNGSSSGVGGSGGGGGGAGGAGGFIQIWSPIITNNSGATISVFGGNGGAGTNGTNGTGGGGDAGGGGGGGGGGAGGNGGVIMLICNTYTNSGLVTVAGGTGGALGTGGIGASGSGGVAANGTNGADGASGTIYQVQF